MIKITVLIIFLMIKILSDKKKMERGLSHTAANQPLVSAARTVLFIIIINIIVITIVIIIVITIVIVILNIIFTIIVTLTLTQ